VFRAIVYAAIAAHYVFMAFGVFGGFLTWRWPRLIWLQAAAALWMIVIVAAHLACPLTWIEDRAREHAGMAPKPGGFIVNHVAGIFFPAGHQPAAMVVAGVIVLVSWVGLAVRLRGRSRRPPPTADSRSRSRRSSPDPTVRR
jgi:Protein of Unknown function (DUF2784)